MKKGFFIGFIVLIMLICLAPVAAGMLGYQPRNVENRPLAREPELINRDGLNSDFPADFDAWWEDHFGFRDELVTAFHSFTLNLFGDTLNEKVIVGREGFLFFDKTLDDYTGKSRLSEQEIRNCAAVLRIMSEYAQQSGAEFLFSVAPNKNTIYPEYMPERICKRSEASNMELLYAELSVQGVNTLDFASMLRQEKSDGLLYYHNDTHWNERGALLAYNAIMEQLTEDFETYENLTPTDETGYAGDLHNFILPAAKSGFTYPKYEITYSYTLDEGARPLQDATFGTTSDVNAESSLLLYRDSFGEALFPLLSSNLGRVLYSKEFPYNAALCDGGYDLVMIELVERNIPNLLTAAPFMLGMETDYPVECTDVEYIAFSRQRNGCTQLYGCFEAKDFSRVYVEVKTGSENRWYEAFPVCDADFADKTPWTDHGVFTLTLPLDENASVVSVRVLG